MSEYECEVCGIVHVDDDGNEWVEENPESRALRIADRIDQAVILNPFQLGRVIAILREELTDGYPSVTDEP